MHCEKKMLYSSSNALRIPIFNIDPLNRNSSKFMCKTRRVGHYCIYRYSRPMTIHNKKNSSDLVNVDISESISAAIFGPLNL